MPDPYNTGVVIPGTPNRIRQRQPFTPNVARGMFTTSGGHMANPVAPDAFNPSNPHRGSNALNQAGHMRDVGRAESVGFYEGAFQDQVGAIEGSFARGRASAEQAHGQGAGALREGLSGSTAGIGEGYGRAMGGMDAGFGAAMGILNPYMQQDMGARNVYADALMNPQSQMFQRLSDERANNINRHLAAQGMLGSSGGRNALIESETQLQNMREQQFYDRARGLFNNAYGMGAELGGRYGEAAGRFGMDYGRGVSDAYGRYGSDAGNFFAGARGDAYRDAAAEADALGRAHGARAEFGGNVIRDSYFGAADDAVRVATGTSEPRPRDERSGFQKFFDTITPFIPRGNFNYNYSGGGSGGGSGG